MSDSDEVTGGIELAFMEAQKLRKMKPDHELLRYVLHPDDDAVWEEYMNRFGKPGISPEQRSTSPAMGYVYAKYYCALREACADPEKEIIVSHESPE